MNGTAAPAELSVERRVFPSWSIQVPATFAETFVDADGYWHAYDERRSVSLTSLVVSEERGPVQADRILRRAPLPRGASVAEVPPGLRGRAVTCAAPRSSRARRLLTGLLATDGRVLLVTITSDDLDWARRVWLSIRGHAVPVRRSDRRRDGERGRRAHRAGSRC